jgi:MFS family permease
LVAALGLSPTLVAGPFFGVMTDRVNIRRASLGHQRADGRYTGRARAVAAGRGALGRRGGGAGDRHHLLGASPGAHVAGPRLVPREMVQHVVAVTALNFNLARLVAPVLAGWIIAGAGAGVALWVAVLCYIPMLAILPGLRPRDLPPRDRAPFLAELRGGIRYAAEAPIIREALILTLIFATLVRGALEVLPVLADGAFGQGAAGLGMLTAAAGAGRSAPPC